MYPQLSCHGIVGSLQLRWTSSITFVLFCRKSLEKWLGRWSLSRNESAGVWASFRFYNDGTCFRSSPSYFLRYASRFEVVNDLSQKYRRAELFNQSVSEAVDSTQPLWCLSTLFSLVAKLLACLHAVLRVVAMFLERGLELVSKKSTKLIQILVLWPNYGLSGGRKEQDARATDEAAMVLVLLTKRRG